MFNRKKCISLLLLMATIWLFVGCGSSISNENEYIDTYDKMQDISEQNAEISANNYQNRMDKIYDEAMEEAMSGFYSEAKDNNEDGNIFDRMTRGIFRLYYNRYGSLKTMAPSIAVISIVSGGIIYLFSAKNKARRKFALYGLIIGVPILMLVLVYGIGIANQFFLY